MDMPIYTGSVLEVDPDAVYQDIAQVRIAFEHLVPADALAEGDPVAVIPLGDGRYEALLALAAQEGESDA